MKRGGRLSRKTPLARATAPLRRSKPLARGNGPKPKRRPQKARISLATMQAVRKRQRGVCAVVDCRLAIAPPPIGFHHVFAKAPYPALVDEPRNIVGLCADHHANHETGARRLTMREIERALALAGTWRMASYLSRHYDLTPR